jgi:hypothetical protein
MVETALFSGYKIQRTKGHMGKRKGQNRGAERREKKKKKRGGEQEKDRETNKTEESKFSAPVSSQRSRGVRASRS